MDNEEKCGIAGTLYTGHDLGKLFQNITDISQYKAVISSISLSAWFNSSNRRSSCAAISSISLLSLIACFKKKYVELHLVVTSKIGSRSPVKSRISPGRSFKRISQSTSPAPRDVLFSSPFALRPHPDGQFWSLRCLLDVYI